MSTSTGSRSSNSYPFTFSTVGEGSRDSLDSKSSRGSNSRDSKKKTRLDSVESKGSTDSERSSASHPTRWLSPDINDEDYQARGTGSKDQYDSEELHRGDSEKEKKESKKDSMLFKGESSTLRDRGGNLITRIVKAFSASYQKAASATMKRVEKANLRDELRDNDERDISHHKDLEEFRTCFQAYMRAMHEKNDQKISQLMRQLEAITKKWGAKKAAIKRKRKEDQRVEQAIQDNRRQAEMEKQDKQRQEAEQREKAEQLQLELVIRREQEEKKNSKQLQADGLLRLQQSAEKDNQVVVTHKDISAGQSCSPLQSIKVIGAPRRQTRQR